MAGIKGPAVFLAQFLRDTPPFNSLENICKWFAELGYAGVQIPGWDRRVIDIDLAATSVAYCDELKGKLAALGLSVTEIPAELLPERPKPTTQSDDDPALREYNAYLADLAKKDKES